VQENVKLSKEIAWTGGKLIFEETPFDEVASKLERWYDIEVEARVPAQNVIRLNAAFEDTPLNEVLHDIAAALDLKYERDGRRVTFHR
jgi:ferric-dicitrate binding protein FerR (iron transport regulator)